MIDPDASSTTPSSTRSALDEYVLKLHRTNSLHFNDAEKKYLNACMTTNVLFVPAAWAVATALLVRRGFRARTRPVHPGVSFAAQVGASGVAFSVASDLGKSKCMNAFIKEREFPQAAVLRQGLRILTNSPLDDKYPGLAEHDIAVIEQLQQQAQQQSQAAQAQAQTQAQTQAPPQQAEQEQELDQPSTSSKGATVKYSTRPLTTYERNRMSQLGGPGTIPGPVLPSLPSVDTSSDAILVSSVPLPRYDRDQSSVDQPRGADSRVGTPDRLWDRRRDDSQPSVDALRGSDAQVNRDQIWQPESLPESSTLSAPVHVPALAPGSSGNSWDRLRAQRRAAPAALTSANISRHVNDRDQVISEAWRDVDEDLANASATSTTIAPITPTPTIRNPSKLTDQPRGRTRKNEFGEEVWVEDDASR